jgi:general nucleoside transport system permease protein
VSVATAAASMVRPGVRRQQLLGILYLAIAAVIVVWFGLGVPATTKTTFDLNLGAATTGGKLPLVVLQSATTAYLLAAVCAFAGTIQLVRGFGRRRALILGLVVAAFVFAFMTWAAAGKSMALTGVFQNSLRAAVPITFGALSGLLCERAGVINIAIEGMLLTGAFVAAVSASAFHNNLIGVLLAVVVGALLAALLAVLAIRYAVDQIIAGTVINIGAVGITSFLSARVLQSTPELNNPVRFDPITIPVLGDIPVVGPVLFRQNALVYALFILIAVIYVALFYTRYGLRVRSVGEHPKAADTVGIDVIFTRYRNVIMGGMVAGLGGAYFTLGSTGSFDREMTAGKGFIGLAAMIFGGWNPIGAFLASLVFGFADALQSRLSILKVPVPSEFLLMVPYVVTIIVVAGLVGRARAPAADGRPYKKE